MLSGLWNVYESIFLAGSNNLEIIVYIDGDEPVFSV